VALGVKIGIHMYFRPRFGGGERCLLTAAEALRALVRRTRELAAAPQTALVAMRRRGLESAQRFSKRRFAEEVRALARELTEC
jgi:hypothetical protein